MKDKNIVELQMDLVDYLIKRGVVAFKGDAIGNDTIKNSYIIGLKNGNVLILNIQKLKSGNSKVGVSEESAEMEKMKFQIRDTSIGADSNVKTGFAVAHGHSEKWKFAPSDWGTINYNDDMERLGEVVM